VRKGEREGGRHTANTHNTQHTHLLVDLTRREDDSETACSCEDTDERALQNHNRVANVREDHDAVVESKEWRERRRQRKEAKM
jgi:hypothetical protein